MEVTYIARGNVRGDCGHRHRTVEAAERCAEQDRRAIRRLPSSPYGAPYSDRRVVAVDERGYETGEEVR